MAEQLINEFTVNRPIDEAWTIITDVERIAPCLPGAELQEIEGEVYRGVVKVKLGAISSQFKGEANFLDRDDATHRAVIKGVGRDTGGRGNASAEITAQAESLSPTSTRVHRHHRPAHHRQGRPVRPRHHGRRQLQADGTVRQQPERDARRAGPRRVPPPRSPRPRESADPVARDRAPSPPRQTTSRRRRHRGARGPQVRKINGPATEPIDLMEVGGSSIAKRAVPAIVALFVVLFLLRRRRS